MLKMKMNTIAVVAMLAFGLASCSSGPQPIKLGEEACTFCKMTISDNHFGAEIVTQKGKVYKFDDTHCILAFLKANTINSNDIKEIYLVNFEEPHNFINAQKAYLFESADLHSPMGGNIASFDDESKLNDAMKIMKGQPLKWNELLMENK